MLGGFRHLGVSSTDRASSRAPAALSSNHKTFAGVTEIVAARIAVSAGPATAGCEPSRRRLAIPRKASDAPPLQALPVHLGDGVLSSADHLDETMVCTSEPNFKVSIADISGG
jgi:hypothetical protein